MQQQPKPAQRILCLIDGYLGNINEGREGAVGKSPDMERKLALLDRYPGRWALVGSEIIRGGVRVSVGTKGRTYARYGYETASANGKTYARRPHPDGVPLSALVKSVRPKQPEPLPVVQPDEFGWSRDEINNALATAKAWLFPTEGIQAV